MDYLVEMIDPFDFSCNIGKEEKCSVHNRFLEYSAVPGCNVNKNENKDDECETHVVYGRQELPEVVALVQNADDKKCN